MVQECHIVERVHLLLHRPPHYRLPCVLPQFWRVCQTCSRRLNRQLLKKYVTDYYKRRSGCRSTLEKISQANQTSAHSQDLDCERWRAGNSSGKLEDHYGPELEPNAIGIACNLIRIRYTLRNVSLQVLEVRASSIVNMSIELNGELNRGQHSSTWMP